MKAAVYTGPGVIEFQDYPNPDAGDGLLLRVKACGVCATDVKAFLGRRHGMKPPMILGHEFAGEVEQSKVPGFEVGDRVAAAPYAGCGECKLCLSGHEELCSRKVFLSSGAFAERVSIPVALVRKTAWKIPEDVSWEEAVLAEPLACCILALSACRWKPGQTLMLVGAGMMGMLLVELARAWGATRILVSEPDAKRRELATELGSQVFDPSGGEDVCAWAREQTEDAGPDVVIAAVGNARVVESVIDCAAPGGVVHMFGGLPRDTMLSVSAFTIHYREVSLIGTSGYRTVDYRLAAEMIANHAVDLRPLISARFPLEKAREALDLASSLGSLKVMLIP